LTNSIRVTCLVDRYWNPDTMDYAGTTAAGELLDILAQTADDYTGKLIPAGVVLLDSGAFLSVPVEFIKKEA